MDGFVSRDQSGSNSATVKHQRADLLTCGKESEASPSAWVLQCHTSRHHRHCVPQALAKQADNPYKCQCHLIAANTKRVKCCCEEPMSRTHLLWLCLPLGCKRITAWLKLAFFLDNEVALCLSTRGKPAPSCKGHIDKTLLDRHKNPPSHPPPPPDVFLDMDRFTETCETPEPAPCSVLAQPPKKNQTN